MTVRTTTTLCGLIFFWARKIKITIFTEPDLSDNILCFLLFYLFWFFFLRDEIT